VEVTLSPELEALIAEQVESGHYPSPGEVVRDALRLLQERLMLPERKRESLRRDVQIGLEALDRGEYDEYDDPSQLAAEIKARGRLRLENLAKGADG
jgi:antitoxin ParD1/3/4